MDGNRIDYLYVVYQQCYIESYGSKKQIMVKKWTKRALMAENVHPLFLCAIYSVGSECERNSRDRIKPKEFSRIT